ncbi:Transketolase [Marasmius tenuissimus]|nr:Transketolase [Marasmius tenuissimus]
MSSFTPAPSDDIAIATIRALSADTVTKANSGHPGAPLGMAPVAHVLFSRFVNANPKNSKWFNRDRFVLSNGNGVGLAIAQAHLGAVYNKDGFDLINNYTYGEYPVLNNGIPTNGGLVFCGDGCLMEGVASEAASVAGHLQLGNLIVVCESNTRVLLQTAHRLCRYMMTTVGPFTVIPNRGSRCILPDISIDGDTAVAFTEDVEKRFSAYGWQVLSVENGDRRVLRLS